MLRDDGKGGLNPAIGLAREPSKDGAGASKIMGCGVAGIRQPLRRRVARGKSISAEKVPIE